MFCFPQLIVQIKCIQITIMIDKLKHQLFTSEKLEPLNVLHFGLKNDYNYYLMIEVVVD